MEQVLINCWKKIKKKKLCTSGRDIYEVITNRKNQSAGLFSIQLYKENRAVVKSKNLSRFSRNPWPFRENL
jgi:hypothetical protein